jgi:hypothetical protein
LINFEIHVPQEVVDDSAADNLLCELLCREQKYIKMQTWRDVSHALYYLDKVERRAPQEVADIRWIISCCVHRVVVWRVVVCTEQKMHFSAQWSFRNTKCSTGLFAGE